MAGSAHSRFSKAYDENDEVDGEVWHEAPLTEPARQASQQVTLRTRKRALPEFNKSIGWLSRCPSLLLCIRTIYFPSHLTLPLPNNTCTHCLYTFAILIFLFVSRGDLTIIWLFPLSLTVLLIGSDHSKIISLWCSSPASVRC